jgi:hypothetical protein
MNKLVGEHVDFLDNRYHLETDMDLDIPKTQVVNTTTNIILEDRKVMSDHHLDTLMLTKVIQPTDTVIIHMIQMYILIEDILKAEDIEPLTRLQSRELNHRADNLVEPMVTPTHPMEVEETMALLMEAEVTPDPLEAEAVVTQDPLVGETMITHDHQEVEDEVTQDPLEVGEIQTLPAEAVEVNHQVDMDQETTEMIHHMDLEDTNQVARQEEVIQILIEEITTTPLQEVIKETTLVDTIVADHRDDKLRAKSLS